MVMTLSILAACSSAPPERLGATKGEIAPCPKSPNCVSTRSREPECAMEPLPFQGTGAESLGLLVEVLRGIKRCTLVTISEDYVHAEFRSAVFRFVDDVDFLVDPDEERIHFRSASRTGYYDFGVNRTRMKKIRAAYLSATGEQAVNN